MAVKILIKRKFKDGNLRAASRLLINHRNGATRLYIVGNNATPGRSEPDHSGIDVERYRSLGSLEKQ
jgi:hypothetical protein